MNTRKQVMKKEVRDWSIPINEIYKHLDSSEKGLSHIQADEKLKKYGKNEIEKRERRHWIEILFSQFTSPLIFILVIASVISYFLGDKIDAIVIIGIVLVNAILGFFQEYKAEKALRELKKYVTLHTKVIRNGEIFSIDSKEIVLGEIVILQRGDIIPADIRLIETKDFTADESILTGESVPVEKTTDIISAKYSLPQDLKNMAFTGTTVSSGSAKGIVTSTGEQTVFSKTAAYLKEEAPIGDFQKGINSFSNMLLKVVLIMTLFIFATNAFLGKGILTSFLFAMALAVGITPEMLPIIMTIALSNGAIRMAKEKVVTKKLASVEDLGNIDVLCCDKTGTLTEGNLSLEKFLNTEGKKDTKILKYGMICSSAKKHGHIIPFDNPLDEAIWKSKEAKILEKEIKSYSLLAENEFDFERRRMSVLAKHDGQNTLIVKGAAEHIIKLCTHIKTRGKIKRITNQAVKRLHNQIQKYENDGYKIIAVSERSLNKKETSKKDEKELTFMGFLLFLDPPKKTTRESLLMLEKLGVELKIISGDSPIITKKICTEVGVPIKEEKVITGEQLSQLNEAEFKSCCKKYNVFARVSPEQKHKIVNAIKEQGHITGFLGDGINDAPAIHAASVGISVDTAVGVAKEAADIILLKKSLRVLAHGIIQGRKTFGNIIKYILNTISANFGNMTTVAVSSLFMKFIPLLPSQILLNNLFSDFPLLTVSTDNVDPQFLKKPKRWDINMINRFMVAFGLLSTVFDLILILIMLSILGSNPELFRTSWFLLSLLSEIIITFSIRTRLPFFKSMPSKWLIISSVLTIAVSVLIIYTEIGKELFFFVPLSISVLMIIFGLLLAYFAAAEILKHIFYKRFDI
jgi:Mg2+-importing ATPase